MSTGSGTGDRTARSRRALVGRPFGRRLARAVREGRSRLVPAGRGISGEPTSGVGAPRPVPRIVRCRSPLPFGVPSRSTVQASDRSSANWRGCARWRQTMNVAKTCSKCAVRPARARSIHSMVAETPANRRRRVRGPPTTNPSARHRCARPGPFWGVCGACQCAALSDPKMLIGWFGLRYDQHIPDGINQP